MVDAGGSGVRLRRSVSGRLFGGTPFQPILTTAVLLEVVLVAIVSGFSSFATVAKDAAPSLVFWVIWLIGVFAAARADSDGVRWHYYLPRRYRWTEIEQIRFGGRLTVSGMSTVGQAVMLVKVRGHEQTIAPAKDCGLSQCLEFARALIALAEAHRVPVSRDPSDEFWNQLDHS